MIIAKIKEGEIVRVEGIILNYGSQRVIYQNSKGYLKTIGAHKLRMDRFSDVWVRR